MSKSKRAPTTETSPRLPCRDCEFRGVCCPRLVELVRKQITFLDEACPFALKDSDKLCLKETWRDRCNVDPAECMYRQMAHAYREAGVLMETRYCGHITCPYCGNVNHYDNETCYHVDGDSLEMLCKRRGERIAPGGGQA